MKCSALVLFAYSFAVVRAQPTADPNDPKKIGKFLDEAEHIIMNIEEEVQGQPTFPPIPDPMPAVDDEDNLKDIGDRLQKLKKRIMDLDKTFDEYLKMLGAAGSFQRGIVLKILYSTLKKDLEEMFEDYQKLLEKKKMEEAKMTEKSGSNDMNMMGMPGKPDMDMDQMPDSVMPTMTPGMDMDADSVPSGIPDLPSEPQTPKEPEIDMGKDQMPDSFIPTMKPEVDTDMDSVPGGIPDLPSEPQTPKEPEIDKGKMPDADMMTERGDMDADKRPEVPDRDEMIPFPPPPPPPFPPKPEEEEREKLQPIVTMKTMKVEKPTISPTMIFPEPQRPQIDVQPFNFFHKLLLENLRIKLNFLDAIKAKVRTMARAKHNFINMLRK